MSARTYLATALGTALPGFRVVAAPIDLDAVTGETLVVYREDVKPGPSHGLRTSTLAIWVLTEQQDTRAAEDPLDASLDDVLDALAGIPGLAWSGAERGVYADKYNGYKVAVTLAEAK